MCQAVHSPGDRGRLKPCPKSRAVPANGFAACVDFEDGFGLSGRAPRTLGGYATPLKLNRFHQKGKAPTVL